MVIARPTEFDRIPPLTAGDRLTLEEFEWRSEVHPDIKKAELIEGMVFLEMSVGPAHGEVHQLVMASLGVYQARHPEVQGLDNTTLRLDRDEVRPDTILRRHEGGRSLRSERRIDGPPELVVEVAASSVTCDSHFKRRLYERSGVKEYLLLQLYERNVEWWSLNRDRFESITPIGSIYESEVFPGLRLDAGALWSGDMAAL